MHPDAKARLGGFVLFVAGLVLAWMAIWRPYQAALAGSPTVTLQRTGIGVGLLFPLMGILLMLGGQSVNEHFKTQTTGKRTRLGWLYIVALGALALTGYLVIESKFRALGYVV